MTSPLQLAQVGPASRERLAAATAYEAGKLADRETAQQCRAQGICLMPVVAESFSGWGATAQKVFNVIARASAARSGESVGVATSRLYEGLNIRIMRAKRALSLSPGCPGGALKLCEALGVSPRRRFRTESPRPLPQRLARASKAPLGHAP